MLNVLIKLRTYNYVISADLEKAFWQIALSEEDKDYIRFLWFKDTENFDFKNFENNELIELRFARVIFGLNSSPFLLQATLQKHIETHCENELKEKLKGALHIDDLNSGEKTIQKAETLYLKAKKCLEKGGFNLRKFRSNSAELEKKIFELFPDDKRYNGEAKILGIRWNKKTDKIIYDFSEIRSKFTENATRRSLLASIASIYDPLGLISPITVKMKILYQKICDEKCKWDEFLPADAMKEWKSILSEFHEIDSIEIDRNYCFDYPSDHHERLEPTNELLRIRTLCEHFWNLWRDEYLLELREHQKRNKTKGKTHPNEGDVVLIKDDKLKRSEWRIGRIKKLIASRDSTIRAAEVHVVTNEKLCVLKRPVNKLFPIEFNETEEENNEKTEVELKFISDKDTITFFVSGSV